MLLIKVKKYGIALVVLAFLALSCKKEEKKYEPLQPAVQLSINGQPAQDVELSSFNFSVPLGNMILIQMTHRTGEININAPAFQGADMNKSTGAEVFALVNYSDYLRVQSCTVHFSEINNNSKYISASGTFSCLGISSISSRDTIKISGSFNNLLHEK